MLQRFFITIFILVSTIVLQAQTFPVQVTPQLVPPYTVKLSDYSTTNSEKLAVNILLTDVNELGRRIRLKMYIEGQGLSVSSQDVVNGASPIFLDGGVNLRLTNLDLQAYFRFDNLLGIRPQQYNNPLPNGAYNYCFEVYDYFSGVKLSSKSCTTVFLVQNDPPILNLPFRDNIVNVTNPQNILFTWSPRHTNLSNVQYEFTLKELWDKQNIQANFLASVPFYRTTTRNTTFLVGPEAPQLLPGKIYGWQVRAFVSDGVSETSVFKNDGKSEIFWFKHIENCKSPSFVISQALSTETVRVNWQMSEHIKYKIQYRKRGFGDDDWFEVNSYTNEGTIYNLEPDTVYEFRVGGECTPLSGYAYSNIQEFTTPTVDEDAYYNCGLMPEIDIKNQDPLPTLEINDTFTAGDFPVVVRKATGSNGTFSGWGYITLPFLEKIKGLIDAIDQTFGSEEGEEGGINIGKYTRIKVQFDNVSINTSYQLTGGVVQTSYDADWGSLLDLDDLAEDVFGDTGGIQQYDASDIDIANVELQENGELLITDEQGNPHTVVTKLPVVVTDVNGDKWIVKEDGTVTQVPAAEGGAPSKDTTNGVSGSGNITQISSKDVTVVFNPSGYYSADTYNKKINSNKYKNEYEFIKKHNGEEYSVLYKLISNNKGEDFVEADVSFANGKTKKDLVFKTKQGTKVDTVWTGNKVKLILKNQFEFVKGEIVATVKPKDSTGKYDIAGKLNVWDATHKTINLTLVSVDGASITGVENRINEIYNKVGVKFNINTDVLNIGLKSLEVGDSDLLSHYTKGEKEIINAYKKNGTKKEQYYMFFLKNSVKLSKPLEGFMPLKRQFGFVFTENDPGRIAAHEIGHGIFGLKHPFKEYNYKETEDTNYLMDNGGGTEFSHMDWQKIHASGIQLYWFQSDEDGQNTVVGAIPNEYANLDGTYTFLTLNGSYITLPKRVKKLSFVTGIDKLSPYVHYPTGALESFEIDEITYRTHVDGIDVLEEYSIDNFTFNYKGFKNYNAKGRDIYHGNLITLLPDGLGRKLLKVKLENLQFKENGTVNILKENTYDFFKKITNRDNHILKNNYPYANTTPYDESYILNEEYVQHFMGDNIDWGVNYFIISKIAFLYNSYPDLFEEYFPSIVSPKTNIQFNISPELGYIVLEKFEISDLIKIYLDLINVVKESNEACLNYINNLTKNSSFNTIKRCLDNLSDQEIRKIGIDNKIMALSILTNKYNFTTNSAEIEIIKLLKFTNDEDIDDLLIGLLEKSKTDTKDFLLKRLTYKIDNDHTWLSDDNYKELLVQISVLCSKSEMFKQQVVSYNDDELADRVVNFYHKSFWNNVTEVLAVGGNEIINYNFFKDCNPDTNVEWTSKESITLNIQNSTTCNVLTEDQEPNLELFPFDPIWFVNKSSLSMLSDYNKNTPILAPAIVVYFANDVGGTQNTIDGIETAVDFASLAIGAGALAKAPSTLRKVYIIADMIGSGVNLTLNSSSENLSPNAKIVLQSLNILTACVALDELILDGTKSISSLYKRVAKENTSPLPSKEQVNNFLDNILAENTSASEIAEIGADKLREAEKWLDNIILEEKVSDFNAVARAKTAKLKILLAKKLLKVDASHMRKSILDLTGPPPININRVQEFISETDDYIDVVIHADDLGENFSMIIEIEGIVKNLVLNSEEFASALRAVPESKTIRLLSCNNSDSAQEIASVLGREIVSSHGETKIYTNGVVEADSWYKAKPNGEIEGLPKTTREPSGDYITLKQKFVDNIPKDIDNHLRTMFDSSRYNEFIKMLTRSNLPGTWKLQRLGNKVQLVDKKGTVWATISNGEIIAKSGGRGDGWNHLLNVDPPLMRGYTYKIDNNKFIFDIDQEGRVFRAQMNPVTIDDSVKRSQSFQSKAKKIKDGSTENVDDGGHIFRNQWGGLSEQINYFSQNAVENRTGAWYNMEDAISNMLQSNNPPTIKLEMNFNFTGTSRRPNAVRVKVYVNDVKDNNLSKTYKNPL